MIMMSGTASVNEVTKKAIARTRATRPAFPPVPSSPSGVATVPLVARAVVLDPREGALAFFTASDLGRRSRATSFVVVVLRPPRADNERVAVALARARPRAAPSRRATETADARAVDVASMFVVVERARGRRDVRTRGGQWLC